jgi:hypothetical protein
MVDEITKTNATGGIAIVPKPCNVEETEQPFGKRWREQVVTLSAEHLRALQDGQYVAVDVQEEYVVFLHAVLSVVDASKEDVSTGHPRILEISS